MSLQIGTVDGLINITKDKINCFVKAINSFSKVGAERASSTNISLGSAFQRYVEPVYIGEKEEFDLDDIEIPVYTRGGKEQSPARLTFCKKMGLLYISDDEREFKPTPICEAIYNGDITIEDYAFLLLSKQGIFANGNYVCNLFVFISKWFSNHSTISEDVLKEEITSCYNDSNTEKTRLDIIINAFTVCGLLSCVERNIYVLADTVAAKIFDCFVVNESIINPALLDSNINYAEYIGSFKFGVFDIFCCNNTDCILEKFPNFEKYQRHNYSSQEVHKNKVLQQISFGSLENEKLHTHLLAMRTKPFLLLAGISGTGKSRIVKQMAFESCPNMDALRKDPTSPGNYQLIEVKPNWHDSTEVLGYESEIGGSHYVATPFVKFLVKAMQYEEKAPFFVCMDEMNLAPVEQYFAEFLSVLESRKLIDGKITSEPLIKADIFKKYESSLKEELFNLPKESVTVYSDTTSDTAELYGRFNDVYERLKTEGLRIPSNLIVVGTVNMDETTHQFSRKVIDRAMTIEMNIEDAETPFKDFFEGGDALHYYDNPQPRELFLPKVVQAADALAQLSEEDADYLKANVPQLLYNLNKALDGTPFKIAYRVQNELVLYFYSLREEKPDTDAETLLASAMDSILMMKVLPRIEGDEDLLEKPLKALAEFTEVYPQASKKIAEMQERLPQAHFTSFWP